MIRSVKTIKTIHFYLKKCFIKIKKGLTKWKKQFKENENTKNFKVSQNFINFKLLKGNYVNVNN